MCVLQDKQVLVSLNCEFKQIQEEENLTHPGLLSYMSQQES